MIVELYVSNFFFSSMIPNKKLVIVKYVSMKAVESENKECELGAKDENFFLRFLRTTVLEDNSRSAFQKNI